LLACSRAKPAVEAFNEATTLIERARAMPPQAYQAG